MRIIGLDVGKRRIGVAVSDESGVCATAIEVVDRRSMKKDEFKWLTDLVDEYQGEEVVVGLPVNMNGQLGDSANETLKYVEHIKDKINIPVKTWDERLSTVQGERILLEADLSRKKRKGIIDKLSAQIILQSYLDYRAHLKDEAK
jgi:putative Holliday junction resolvase